METLKDKAMFAWKHNKVAIIAAWLLRKVLATAILIQQCNGPEQLPDTIKQKVDFTSEQCDD